MGQIFPNNNHGKAPVANFSHLVVEISAFRWFSPMAIPCKGPFDQPPNSQQQPETKAIRPAPRAPRPAPRAPGRFGQTQPASLIIEDLQVRWVKVEAEPRLRAPGKLTFRLAIEKMTETEKVQNTNFTYDIYIYIMYIL